MWQEHYFPPLHNLRRRCDDRIRDAVEAQDWKTAMELREIRGYLRHDDCLKRTNWRHMRPREFLPPLGYTRSSVVAVEEKIERLSQFRGKLQATDNQGQVHVREAILDTDVEEYYMFEDFGFFKIHSSWGFFSLNYEGQWEFDAEAERRYFDAQYDYYPAKIIRISSNP